MAGDRILVLDFEIPEFLHNRVLDAGYAARFPGASTFALLGRLAREQGWRAMTADIFLSQEPRFDSAVTLSNEFTKFLPQLRARGVTPGVLISGESPVVAPEFYRQLPLLSAPFRYAYLFRGSLARLHYTVHGQPWLWPCPDRVLEADRDWKERSLLGLVAGFKGVWHGPRGWVAQLPKKLRSVGDNLQHGALQVENLYDLRLRMVRQYAGEQGFVLRGSGWENTLAGRCRWWRKPIRYGHPPSPCDDKLSVLAECRFGLAIENAVFPGYVTEKVFDVLRAGAVPVYLGAPDIHEFVPAECIVDAREHPSLAELWSHLGVMDEGRWRELREAGRGFLRSAKYARHHEENVAREWLSKLTEVAR